MQKGAVYSIFFAAVVCLVCAVFVSSSAVSLRSRQEANAFLDKQRNVLIAAGLANEDETLTTDEIQERFAPIDTVVVDLETGEELPDVDPETFDQRAAASDPNTSREAPANPAGIERVPNQALVYRLEENGELRLLILPIEGKGLWSTLYGFIALDADLDTIQGITFYEHKETPGLGGEVDNPRWKALWPGRRAFGDDDEPRIQVIRGQAGPPSEDPYRVDGLSGATMTSRGVGRLVRFWLGDDGFAPYLDTLREGSRG
jgi:Na+-transporting NADH:ubiquinone oxidoreductase subunit C